MKGIIIYSQGIVAMSVCVYEGTSKKEIEDHVNAVSPTGISTAWRISEKYFADGKPNPCPCDKESNRRHYLLNC